MIVGIDLGTTNSLIAVWENGSPRLITNSLGEVLTPSCVSVDEDGSILVGRAAKERLQTHPDKTAAVFKRYMGSQRVIKLGRREYRPEELSALVLRSLKEDAEAALGVPITEAIITVPAYFSDAQRKATRAAGVLAGLRVDRLLNEPTAAALAYGIHQRGEESRFLIFDLGGGTFDVSVLDMFEGVMEVRASAGDNYLGGEDFVSCILEHFFEKNKLSPSLRKDSIFMQRLGAQIEASKRELSHQSESVIQIMHDKNTYSLQLSEATLEQICKPLLQRLRTPVEKAIRDANFSISDLDQIVLAGGASRMPIVRKLVTKMFGRFPACDINPDEVVALGAAVQAGLKMKDAALDDVVMTDVAPYSLGVEVAVNLGTNNLSTGHFDPIIDRNSTVPISRSKMYSPIQERQKCLEMNIYQGEARLVKDNILLGTLKVALPDAPREQCGVDMRFTYDVNGLLQIEATVKKTQETFSMVIEGNPGLLSEAEIATRLAALSKLKIHPRDQMENRALLARAERLYQQLLGNEREWFSSHIHAFEALLETQDPRQVAPGQKRLEEVITQLERQIQIFPSPDNQT